jgi:hypothetical protein
MRRMLAPLAIATVLLGHVFTGGCSSESSLSGGGGCEAFCSKWIGARCRNSPTKEACLEKCHDEQTRCRIETNALLKCATIEAQIACETGSGQPRVVGCLAREASQQECLRCDHFCEGWSALGCPRNPIREECVAACLDQRCQTEHLRIVECMPSGLGTCGPEGAPKVRSGCEPAYDVTVNCTTNYGQSQPFRWLAVEQLDTGQLDTGQPDAGRPDAATGG